MDTPLITVFTPTYNRKDCIEKCYKSLCRQSSFNFEWLIIDDGSTDDTCSLIHAWQNQEKNFCIRYYKKENGGLHTAYNKGIELARTELFVCIDSDDWMPDGAVQSIERLWKRISGQGYVGIMGMDCYANGSYVGDAFPENVHEMYLYEKMTRYHLNGDKKMIHKTSLLKKVAPMPTFLGEKQFNPSYMMYQLDQFGKLYVTNTCYCIVDYQPDGMSSNIFTQYRNSPNSFIETRKLYLSFPGTSRMFQYRQYVHYISECILAHRFCDGIREAEHKAMAYCAVLPGLMLSWVTKLKAHK